MHVKTYFINSIHEMLFKTNKCSEEKISVFLPDKFVLCLD